MIKAVEHGGNLAHLAALAGYEPTDCIDFSANINPLGLSRAVRNHLIRELDHLTVYPDVKQRQARDYLATYHGLEPENFLLCNGAVEAFYDFARWLQPKRAWILEPTFLEYRKAFASTGAQIQSIPLKEPAFTWTFESLRLDLAAVQEGDVVVLCNPNNPTGTQSSRSELEELVMWLGRRGAWCLLDEAFIDFIEEEDASLLPLLQKLEKLVIVRSLTKFFALPGLRLGYMTTGHATCLEEIRQQRPPWTVNHLAASALPVLLADTDYQRRTYEWLAKEQAYLYQGLKAFPSLSVHRPTANFIFFRYKGQRDLRQRLWEQKLLIRSCWNYPGLGENYYRVGIRSHLENRRLLEVLGEVLENEKGDS